MARANKKLILFDIDGTLLLTGGAGKLAFERVFEELFGLKGAWFDVHPDGRTDPSLIDELFEKNLKRKPKGLERKKVQECYESAMASALQEAKNFRLMPGIRQLLAILEERGWGMLGLATGNFEKTAYQKIHHAGLKDFFTFGGFGSDHADRLHLTKLAMERGFAKLGKRLSPEDVVLVGDTIHDIRCGRLLDMTTLAVATGSTRLQALAEARPDYLFPNLEPDEALLSIFE